MWFKRFVALSFVGMFTAGCWGPQEVTTSSDATPSAVEHTVDDERRLPPPTENYLDSAAERDHKRSRKEWMRRRHRSAEGTDWEAIEQENGRRQIRKRNALARLEFRETDSATWVERGSDNQAGRMHVAVHSSDGGALYAGSSRGGIWRADLDGRGWTPLGDNLFGGAHHLVVLPAETAGAPEVMIAATDGGMIHRSEDDGETWVEPSGLPWRWQIRRLSQMSDGSGLVFVLTSEAEDERRLYRSADGGKSFQQVYFLGKYNGDFWVPRDGGERHLSRQSRYDVSQ